MRLRRLARSASRIAARIARRCGAWRRTLATTIVGRARFGSRRRATADALGRRGERAAERALVRRGYRILARRRRTTGGEADLVAVDGETLVLVEVKASIEVDAGAPPRAPADRVDRRKRIRLRSASSALRRGPLAHRPHRIDVVSVVFRGRRADVTVLRGAVGATRARGRPRGR